VSHYTYDGGTSIVCGGISWVYNRIISGTQTVYGAKYHMELSITPYTHMVGVPLGSITSQPWYSCSPDTTTELNT